jgi:pyroglutamyl-peptidase
MRTLLTGFSAFLNVGSNPTERLARHFETHGAEGHELTVRVLPVSYESAARTLRETFIQGGRDGEPFEAVLMLGVAAGAKAWRVERVGWNACDTALPDALGVLPPAIIDGNLPQYLPSTLPHDAIAKAIRREGLPAVQSDSAGRYLCNYLLFSALAEVHRQNSKALVGFLHVPADEQTYADNVPADAILFPFEQHIQAVRAALDALHG